MPTNFLDVNVAAYHWDRQAVVSRKLNESNPGIGLEHVDGRIRTAIGYYKNSLFKPSLYGFAGVDVVQKDLSVGKLSFGILAGGVTGYNLPVAPVIGAVATFQAKRLGVNILLTPNAKIGGQNAYGFAGLQMRVQF